MGADWLLEVQVDLPWDTFAADENLADRLIRELGLGLASGRTGGRSTRLTFVRENVVEAGGPAALGEAWVWLAAGLEKRGLGRTRIQVIELSGQDRDTDEDEEGKDGVTETGPGSEPEPGRRNPFRVVRREPWTLRRIAAALRDAWRRATRWEVGR